MDTSLLIGNIAAFLTTFSFLPQAIKVIRTKDTHSISLPMYILFVFGVAMWLTYGFLISDLPLILANTVTLLFSSIILVYKIKNSLQNKKEF